MKWSRMSPSQKILYVAGIICVAACLALSILNEIGTIKNAGLLFRVLQVVWCVCMGYTQENRFWKVVWYILAGLWLLLCLWMLFIIVT